MSFASYLTIIGIVFKFVESIDEWPLPFHVAMWDLKDCNPRKCTGKKLVKHNLMKILRLGTLFPGLCLTPLGNEVVIINRKKTPPDSLVPRCNIEIFYYSV